MNFSTLSALSLWFAGLPEDKKINVLVACASFYVRASGYTSENRHEGICHISHAIDISASSELKVK